MIWFLAFDVLLWLGCCFFYIRSGKASFFHPLTYYLFFHVLVFVFRPIFSFYYSYSVIYQVYQFIPTDADRLIALLAADLGMIAFVAGALRTSRAKLVLNPSPRPRSHLHRHFRGSFLVAAAACVGPAVYSLNYLVSSKLEANGTMILDPSTGITINTSSNGYLADANNMLIPIVVLLPWLYRFKPASLLPFLLFTFARLLNGGGRWAFVMAAASLSLALLYERRAKWLDVRTIGLAAVVMLLFTAVGDYRGYFAAMLSDKVAERRPDTVQTAPMEGMDYGNQEYLEYLIYTIPQRTKTYGLFLDNLQVLTEPIPRVLWPGKPIGAPVKRYDLWKYGAPIGMTLSLPGEGWAQAGFLGVVIWCGVWGLFFGKIYDWFARSRQTEFQVAGYILLLPLSIQFFRDGTLLTFVKFPLFYLVPLALWWLVARINGRRVRRRITISRRLRPVGMGV